MDWLSTKEKINKATTIYDKLPADIFMSAENIRKVVKEIFLLHQSNGGKLHYLYFRRILPNIMHKWIINKINLTSSNMDYITYINKLFIKNNDNLYRFKSNNFIDRENSIDTNVFRVDTTLGISIDDEIIPVRKKGKELMASDYQLIDVWKPQSTEISTENFRNGNKIPVWQRSLNTRNYDRLGDGYASVNPDDASLNSIYLGYGSDFSNLIKKNQDLYKKNNPNLI